MVDKYELLKKYTSGELTIALTEEKYNELLNQPEIKQSREEYEFIKNAIEKQIPKEHHYTRINKLETDFRESICPSCLGVITTTKAEYPKYCCWCGQAIWWDKGEKK